jgi:hypothetical protein
LRAAFVVGWDSGFPWDVWALFTSQREAQRHADAAAYVFRVFALPVYEDYSEVPRAFRPPLRFRPPRTSGARLRDPLADEVTLTTDALIEGEIEVVKPGPVAAIVDPEPPEPQEVRLLFTDNSAAARYLQEAADWMEMQRSQTMSVYGSYDDCRPSSATPCPDRRSPNMCVRASSTPIHHRRE